MVVLIEFLTGGDFTESQELLADYNQDGVVNVADAVALVQSILNP